VEIGARALLYLKTDLIFLMSYAVLTCRAAQRPQKTRFAVFFADIAPRAGYALSVFDSARWSRAAGVFAAGPRPAAGWTVFYKKFS
jgi:hypothetical protein